MPDVVRSRSNYALGGPRSRSSRPASSCSSACVCLSDSSPGGVIGQRTPLFVTTSVIGSRPRRRWAARMRFAKGASGCSQSPFRVVDLEEGSRRHAEPLSSSNTCSEKGGERGKCELVLPNGSVQASRQPMMADPEHVARATSIKEKAWRRHVLLSRAIPARAMSCDERCSHGAYAWAFPTQISDERARFRPLCGSRARSQILAYYHKVIGDDLAPEEVHEQMYRATRPGRKSAQAMACLLALLGVAEGAEEGNHDCAQLLARRSWTSPSLRCRRRGRSCQSERRARTARRMEACTRTCGVCP